MNGNPGSWPGRVLSGAVGLLLATVALRWAVQIIESIWPTLAVCAAVIAIGAIGGSIWRSRRDRW